MKQEKKENKRAAPGLPRYPQIMPLAELTKRADDRKQNRKCRNPEEILLVA